MEEAEKAIGLAAHEMERRGMPRCLVDEEATLVVVSRGLTIPGRLMELSAGGCRIALKEKLAQGMHAAVETNFRVRGIAFRLSGITEWTAGSNVVGVSFGPMSARRRDDLLEVLCEVEAENAAKAAEAADKADCPRPDAGVDEAALPAVAARVERGSQPAPIARHELARPMARPENVQLLNAVLRKVAGAAAPGAANGNTARAPAGLDANGLGANGAATNGPGANGLDANGLGANGLDANGRTEDRPGVGEGSAPKGGVAGSAEPGPSAESAARPRSRRDRRLETRCDVDTSVAIHLVKIASRLPGQILDLSLGGCRIHTVDRFPVGIYTRVEIEFRLQGTALLLGGVVQAIHGRNEVGIRFLDVSARKREQLAELIEEIREMRESE
jgi:c-di-GMP-binding flagellar brake protein YcgR